jgi:mono/diheme cytochrome c family protein
MFAYRSFATVLSLAGLLTLVSAAPARAQADAGMADAGMKVFAAQKCSICHAIGGKGNKKYPLDDVGKKLSAEQIREWVVTPAEAAKKANSTAKPAMKASAALPKADLDALVAYLKTLDGK